MYILELIGMFGFMFIELNEVLSIDYFCCLKICVIKVVYDLLIGVICKVCYGGL